MYQIYIGKDNHIQEKLRKPELKLGYVVVLFRDPTLFSKCLTKNMISMHNFVRPLMNLILKFFS